MLHPTRTGLSKYVHYCLNFIQFCFLWLSDFNCMLICQGLFYAKILGNRIHCRMIFWSICFLKVFNYSRPFRIWIFSNRSIWPIDVITTGTSILIQSGPGGNCYEKVLHTPQNSWTEFLSVHWKYYLPVKNMAWTIYYCSFSVWGKYDVTFKQ